MARPIIFISYRREDSVGHAGRIFDRLVEEFDKEHLFRDVDTVPAGEDFVEAIRAKINQSDILLALIGPRWLTATDEEGRWRLADENDWVRVEIEAALNRNIRVIPVLLQGAAIPKAKDLPGALAKLAQRSAVEIRDTHFDLDTAQLIEILRPSWRNKLARVFARWPVYAVIAVVLANLLGFWVYTQFSLTPEKARIQIVQMGMAFDADAFVDRCKNNDMQAVDLFLRAGIAPDAQDSDNYTGLKAAAANGHLDIVKKLVDHGADLGLAMPWAAGHGQRDVLDYMLARDPGLTAINRSLRAAAGSEHADIVKLLLDKGADANYLDQDQGSSPLLEAVDVFSPNIETVRLLLSKGADVNQQGDGTRPSALFLAAGKFNPELVDLLLTEGANVNVVDNSDSTPLLNAITVSNSGGDEAEQQRQAIIENLVRKGADLRARAKWMESWQPTPLLLAIHRDLPQVAMFLISQGAEVNDKTGDTGSSATLTALMQAAHNGMTDVVKALLAKGADVNTRNEDGDSALLIAARSPHGDETVPQLLANGAEASVANNKGQTVLMSAAGSNWGIDDTAYRSLIARGAQINATDANGWTALMYAADARYERSDVVEQLLKLGADKTIRNDEGDDALAISSKENRKKIARLLSPQTSPGKR